MEHIEYITINDERISVKLLPEDIQSSVRVLNKYREKTLQLVKEIEDCKVLMAVLEDSISTHSEKWASRVLNNELSPGTE